MRIGNQPAEVTLNSPDGKNLRAKQDNQYSDASNIGNNFSIIELPLQEGAVVEEFCANLTQELNDSKNRDGRDQIAIKTQDENGELTFMLLWADEIKGIRKAEAGEEIFINGQRGEIIAVNDEKNEDSFFKKLKSFFEGIGKALGAIECQLSYGLVSPAAAAMAYEIKYGGKSDHQRLRELDNNPSALHRALDIPNTQQTQSAEDEHEVEIKEE